MKKLTIFFLILFSLNSMAEWSEEKKKIDYLILQISKSKGTFIRNGSEHSSKEASEHLNRKLNSALSSWFSPDKKDWTAKLFIKKIASKSSFSGKSYKIKFSDGKVVETKDWLLAELEKYKKE
ncbi:DUF5329 family protein [Halobacteriovorax sp.]|uniref:DUF5329 family protein n=1 Tax=Halobacteriovorax sp. TaxID=2020862 RepID=UPI003563B43A